MTRSPFVHVMWVLPGLVLLCLLGTAQAAEDARIGEAWEAPIAAGIEKQDRARTTRSVEAILREAQLAAARRADATTQIVRYYLLARAHGIAGDEAGARRAYQTVLRAAPRCYFVYRDLAMLDLGRAQPDNAAAERNLRQAIDINPGYTTALRNLAMLMLQTSRTEQAIPHLRRLVGQAPTDLRARLLLARTLMDSQQLDEAEREIQILLREDATRLDARMLQCELLLKRGRYREAMGAYRKLATENPALAAPLRGYLRALDSVRQESGDVDPDQYLWALEGLYRLEQDAAQREKLRESIEQFRTFKTASENPEPRTGPPTDAELAQAIQHPKVEARLGALRYVYAREDPPSGDVLAVTMRRLKPSAESDGRVRAMALRAIARHGGYGLVGLLRHSLTDPDSTVRATAVDGIEFLAGTREAASGAAILVLGLKADSSDAALSVAARGAVLRLAHGTLPESTEDTPAGQLAAFRAWWKGPVATESRIQALAHFHELRDPRAEDIVIPYFDDADDHVFLAAWKAMAAVRRQNDERVVAIARQAAAEGRSAPAVTARTAWLRRVPPVRDHVVRQGTVAAARDELRAWAAARPR